MRFAGKRDDPCVPILKPCLCQSSLLVAGHHKVPDLWFRTQQQFNDAVALRAVARPGHRNKQTGSAGGKNFRSIHEQRAAADRFRRYAQLVLQRGAHAFSGVLGTPGARERQALNAFQVFLQAISRSDHSLASA